MKTRYLKVIRDLTYNYSKNLMLVLAIALGVFGIGSILGGYSVIKREMKDNYIRTVPASATIELEDSISASLIQDIRKLPGIKIAERHATISARMKIGDQWRHLLLFVIDDFEGKQTNKFAHISGKTTPPNGSMLVERSALVVMNAKEGDGILIKIGDREAKEIKLAGVVHDPSLAPAWQEGGGYGYISLSTLRWLRETQGFDQLRLLVSEKQDSRQHIIEKATEVADWLKENDYHVHEIQVPPPGRHPHQSQMDAVMSIFIVFSFLILILGSILVSTSMATFMVSQVRQIGIMKAIGANSFQVSRLYFLMMFIICVVALLVSVPLSRFVAFGFYQQIAELLNLEIRNDSIAFWVPLVQIGSGLIIPLLAAAFPVVRGSRISVRLALDNYGVSQVKQVVNSWVIKLSQLSFLNEMFLLSLRNVFRQRSRLIMTLGLLAAGGAMFITSLNVSEAWEDNLDRIYSQKLYDLEIRLNNSISEDSILNLLKDFPGIKYAEGWNQSSTSHFQNDRFEITHTYPDKGHGSFTMQAVPVPTQLLNLTIVEGQWLRKGNSREVVLNQLARGFFPGVKTGNYIVLLLDGKPTEWQVIGFTEDVGTPATAYVPQKSYGAVQNTPDEINMLRIGYSDRSKENAEKKNVEIEKLLLANGISLSAVIPVWILHNAIAAHMKVLVNSLLAMAVLMGIVGTLGLMSTMSMNVVERTREIGVMRAIGATPEKIRMLVTGEGFIIGVLSIFIAFIFSLVLSTYLGKFIGNMAFRTPLTLTLSASGFLIWILVIIVGSYIATFYPARRANKITTREALAYE